MKHAQTLSAYVTHAVDPPDQRRSASLRKLAVLQPDARERLHQLFELVERTWLFHVQVGSGAVGGIDVFLVLRGGENDDGGGPQCGASPNLLQNFEARSLGEIEIQEDKVGARSIGVSVVPSEELQRFFAVVDNAQPECRAVIRKELAEQTGVWRKVLNQEDLYGMKPGFHLLVAQIN